MNFKKILIVCAGNICRSPMGEAFFKQSLDSSYTIDSAGIVGLINHPADDNAIKVMNDIGFDISNHQGKRLNAELLKNFDLVLVMTKRQVTEISQKWPFAKGKVFRIGEWQDKDVPDPYKHNEDAFIDARELIRHSVDAWIEKL